MTVKYKLADSQQDFQQCYDLMDTEKVEREDLELKFPCVMAFDEDEVLIGFLGTHFNEDMVVGGPLLMRDRNPQMLTVYNLCELYEMSMRHMGIKSYIMSVEDGNFMDQAIKRYNPPNLEQYAREGNLTFYIRRL